MAWTVPTIRATGDLITAAIWNADVENNLLAVFPGTSAYTAYTPTWTSTGAAPVLGNGSIVGSFLRIGNVVQSEISLTMGSTTTYGSGVYLFSLPVALGAAFGTNVPLGWGSINTAGGAVYPLAAVAGAGAVLLMTLASPGVSVIQSTPVTLATGDAIRISTVTGA